MRDFQRSKVYRSEWDSIDPLDTDLTLVECQELADNIVDHPEVRQFPGWERLRRHGVQVIPARRGGGVAYNRWTGSRWVPTVGLGPDAFVPSFVVHEVTHHLVGLDLLHGAEFASGLLHTSRLFLGDDAADRLLDAYAVHKVRLLSR